MRAVAAAALAALVLPAAAAAEAPPSPLVARYAVAWAGLEVGAFEVELARESGGGYRLAWRGGTAGLAGRLFPFATEGSSVADAAFRSRRHEGRSRWRDGGGAAWAVEFAPDGRATRVTADERAGPGFRREPVPPALRVGPDPGTLALMALAAAGPGAGFAGRGFDGRRVVAFEASCDPGPQGSGAAEVACAVRGSLLAGGAAAAPRPGPGREPLRVWLRRGVAREGWWPVRLEATTRLGRVTARLAEARGTAHIGE